MTLTRSNRLVALALGWREEWETIDRGADERSFWRRPDGCVSFGGPPDYANDPKAVGQMIEWLLCTSGSINVASDDNAAIPRDRRWEARFWCCGIFEHVACRTLNRALCAAILRLQRHKTKEPKP